MIPARGQPLADGPPGVGIATRARQEHDPLHQRHLAAQEPPNRGPLANRSGPTPSRCGRSRWPASARDRRRRASASTARRGAPGILGGRRSSGRWPPAPASPQVELVVGHRVVALAVDELDRPAAVLALPMAYAASLSSTRSRASLAGWDAASGLHNLFRGCGRQTARLVSLCTSRCRPVRDFGPCFATCTWDLEPPFSESRRTIAQAGS